MEDKGDIFKLKLSVWPLVVVKVVGSLIPGRRT